MNNEIESAYDQSLLVTPSDFALFSEVDKVVSDSLLQASPQPAMAFGRNLRREGQLKGLALAKLLSKLDQSWDLFQRTGIEERIEDIILVEMGISPQTTRKYIRLWEDLFENQDIPDAIKDSLYGKSIKSLLLLTAAARDGDAIDWQKVADAENGAEIRDLVRGVRGPTTSSETSIIIVLDRDGTLFAKKGTDGARVLLGHFRLEDIGNPIVEKAIMRIVERGGIIWK